MLDFRRMAQKYHLAYLEEGHHHCHDGWVQVHCPFCAGGRSGWHLGFSLTQGSFNCWRCGGLRFWDVLPVLLRVNSRDLKEIVDEFQTDKRPEPKQITRQRTLSPPPDTGPLLGAHRRYLEGRRFDPDALVDTWGILGCGPLGGEWAWRVVMPIQDGDDRIVAYQGRIISEEVKPKYKMEDDEKCLVDPKTLLYGINKVEGNTVLVVEGVPGVWRIGPGTVATFGIDFHKAQANRLRRFKKRFILFDPEALAQKRARQLASHLALFEGETEILSGFQTDPGEFSDRRVQKVRKEIGLQITDSQ